MDLVSTIDLRYVRTPDGAIWSRAIFAHKYWTRYLDVFDHVKVVARVIDAPSVPSDWYRADGEGVSFAPLPHFVGPAEYISKARQVRNAARESVGPMDAVIVYAGSQISNCVIQALRRMDRPYGVHVGGDPFDVFAPGSVKHPLRPFFRWWFTRQQQDHCRHAAAALYVTDSALQRRYPCPEYTIGATDVELPDEAVVSAPRNPDTSSRTRNLVMVGTLEQLYKAPDVLIDAVSRCVKEGLDLKLTIIGDGKHRSELEQRAASLGLGERIRFLGQLPSGGQVLRELDSADLFLLPSYQEGLPRAMIEAMARALPCIGSTVGGIPELLALDDMVPPGDVKALAAKIREVITDPDRMAAMSERNLEKAGQYREDVLRERRLAFYRYIKDKTEEWLEKNGKSDLYTSQQSLSRLAS